MYYAISNKTKTNLESIKTTWKGLFLYPSVLYIPYLLLVNMSWIVLQIVFSIVSHRPGKQNVTKQK